MPLAGAVDKLGGCHAAEAAVRSQVVVVGPPCLDDPPRRSKRGEQMLVQTPVPEAPIKALDEAVLLRLAWRDVMPLDAGVLAPGEDRMAGQLGAIVADHH